MDLHQGRAALVSGEPKRPTGNCPRSFPVVSPLPKKRRGRDFCPGAGSPAKAVGETIVPPVATVFWLMGTAIACRKLPPTQGAAARSLPDPLRDAPFASRAGEMSNHKAAGKSGDKFSVSAESLLAVSGLAGARNVT